jgi:hypothetical protein
MEPMSDAEWNQKLLEEEMQWRKYEQEQLIKQEVEKQLGDE